jgi:hypothetical protein
MIGRYAASMKFVVMRDVGMIRGIDSLMWIGIVRLECNKMKY